MAQTRPIQKKTDAADASQQTKTQRGGLGVTSLVFLIISAMIGGGIFNLPQAAAAVADPQALIVAWIATLVGVYFLVLMFRMLSRIAPDLKNGLYAYAEHGFGKFMGFIVAFSYWLSNCLSLVTYGILIGSALNFFFPGAFTGGSTLLSLIVVSCIYWVVFAINIRGVDFSAHLNIVGTICKFIPIVLFIIVMILSFSPDTFAANCQQIDGAQMFKQFGGAFYVTVFLFVGIEGAVVMSGSAASQKKVARATLISFAVSACVYIIVSLIAFGVFSSDIIAAQQTPSLAGLFALKGIPSCMPLVFGGVIVSEVFALIVWMMMIGQMPTSAAEDGVFPRIFTKRNKWGAPYMSLLVSVIVTEIALVIVSQLGEHVWQFLVSFIPIIVMPCYTICCLYLIKRSLSERWRFKESYLKGVIIGSVGLFFTLVVLSRAQLELLPIVFVLYLCAMSLYLLVRKRTKQTPSQHSQNDKIQPSEEQI